MPNLQAAVPLISREKSLGSEKFPREGQREFWEITTAVILNPAGLVALHVDMSAFYLLHQHGLTFFYVCHYDIISRGTFAVFAD